MSMSEVTSPRRRGYCAATVRTVMDTQKAEWYEWLRVELERQSFEHRTTAGLRELAEVVGVTNLDELDRLPDEPEPIHGEYLCPDCQDNAWVPRQDGLYVRCQRCNPPEDTDHEAPPPPPDPGDF